MTQHEPEPGDIDARIEALRKAYLAALPDKRTELAAHWQACAAATDAEAWRALHALAHRLSGSAPCYGLDEVGAAAQRLDRQLSGRPPARDRALLAPLVERLLHELQRAASG